MLSPKLNVYSIEWLNVVFANRNQSYGAYELRKNYNWRLAKALMIASAVVIGGVCAPLIYRNLNLEDTAAPMIPSGELNPENPERIIKVNLPSKKVEPVKPKGDAAPAAKVKIVQMTSNIKVTAAENVTVDPPTQTEMQSAVVGNVNQDGAATTGNIAGTAVEGEGGIGLDPASGAGLENSDEIIIGGSLEHQPEFPGGMEAFANYLRKHLRYPASAADNGIAGKVYVNFVVERDGSLTDIKVARGVGFGCDEEAMRVLKKSPKWSAGEQNGRKVRVMFTVPIVFSMGE